MPANQNLGRQDNLGVRTPAYPRFIKAVKTCKTRQKYLASLQGFFRFLGMDGLVEEMMNEYGSGKGHSGSGDYAQDVFRYTIYLLGGVLNKGTGCRSQYGVVKEDASYSDLLTFLRAYERLVRAAGIPISWEGINGHYLRELKLPGTKRYREKQSDKERITVVLERLHSRFKETR